MIPRKGGFRRNGNVFTVNQVSIPSKLFAGGDIGSKFCRGAVHVSRTSRIKENS
jgi:hypothetical protein